MKTHFLTPGFQKDQMSKIFCLVLVTKILKIKNSIVSQLAIITRKTNLISYAYIYLAPIIFFFFIFASLHQCFSCNAFSSLTSSLVHVYIQYHYINLALLPRKQTQYYSLQIYSQDKIRIFINSPFSILCPRSKH